MNKSDIALSLMLSLIEKGLSPLTSDSSAKDIADYFNELMNNLDNKLPDR